MDLDEGNENEETRARAPFKYRATPLNILCGILFIWIVYSVFMNWPLSGEAKFLFILLTPMIIVLVIDYLFQMFFKKYLVLFLVEIAAIIIIYQFLPEDFIAKK